MKSELLAAFAFIGLVCQTASGEVTWRTGDRVPPPMEQSAIEGKVTRGVKGVRMICDATGVSTRESVPAGETLLPPLSLTISAQPGTYHPSLTDPQFTDTTHVTFPATTGQPLVIAIGQ